MSYYIVMYIQKHTHNMHRYKIQRCTHAHTKQDAYSYLLGSTEILPDCRHPELGTDSHTYLLYTSSCRKEY